MLRRQGDLRLRQIAAARHRNDPTMRPVSTINPPPTRVERASLGAWPATSWVLAVMAGFALAKMIEALFSGGGS